MSIGSHQSAAAFTTDWITPREILSALGTFDLDPCTPVVMPWQTAAKRFTVDDDGLAQGWFGRVWLNPPYGREIDAWMERMAKHRVGTALIFARTETAFWHNHIWPHATAILFLKGRLHFHYPDGRRAKANAGAPSVLIAYGDDDAAKLESSGIQGKFIRI